MADSPKVHSFAWLNLAQFLGALNDNMFKLLVIFLLVDVCGDGQRTAIIATASLVFVAPFLLFSHAGGVLADRFSKRNIIVCLKVFEIFIMLAGFAAVYFRIPGALYTVLFMLCTHSALFGPSKYGIVPELVSTARLSRANAALEGFTYLAIIAGTFIPSYILLNVLNRDFAGLAAFCIVIAVLGLLSGSRIERTPAAGVHRRFSPFFIADLFRTLNSTRKDHDLFITLLGSAYFLFIGAFIQQNTLLYGKDYLNLDWIESGYLFPVAALGIGAGALLSGKLSGRNIEFGIVPIGAFGLTFTCIALGAVAPVMMKVQFLIFLIGFFSGLFIVPLNAFIQFRSPANRRGEILACSNFLSFLGVALSAAALYLLNVVLGLDAGQCFLAIGLLTGILAAVSLIVLPDFFTRFVILVVTRCIYRVRTIGIDNVPTDGGALLVPNHVTWVDALLIGATQQRRVRFMMLREICERSFLRPIFKLMRVIPVSSADKPHKIAESLQRAREAMDDGYMVCIFAEGTITRNGNFRGFRSGLEHIMKGTGHPIIPVYIGGAWGSVFSYYYGKIFRTIPKKIPFPVTIMFGKPMPSTSTAAEVERAVSELSSDWFELEKDKRGRTLPARFVETVRRFWFITAMSDTTGKRLTYGHTLAAAIALSDVIDRKAEGQEHIGLLLPSSVGGALANMAITLLGRVPVNLNFTASGEALASAIRQCNIRTVISSKTFIAKLEGLKAPEGTVYIEDLLAEITSSAKFIAFMKAILWPARLLQHGRRVKPDDLATIIFSSGSTAEPKGVMLSHHNVISNIEGFRMILRLEPQDKMCCTLPFFHSFGFTCCLWCPALSGFEAVYHMNPLDGAKIAEIVREEKLTIMLSTPTFLLPYIRKATREDFVSLRAVITGAEKLRKKTADAFQERFGLRPMEGYGATELSPVAAVSIADVAVDGVKHTGSKEGSIGHPIPGMTMKVVDTETGAVLPRGKEGLLLVRGPNVMLGYLNNPAKTAEVLKDKWYSTGDIAFIDDDGFIFLRDRMSRYSKIGGEMVPHLAIEDKYLQALGCATQAVFVSSAPDEKRGEQVIVFYTDEAGTPEKLHEIISASDLPNLWKPKKENYMHLAALPTLGSGKTDLKRLKTLAEEFVAGRETRSQN